MRGSVFTIGRYGISVSRCDVRNDLWDTRQGNITSINSCIINITIEDRDACCEAQSDSRLGTNTNQRDGVCRLSAGVSVSFGLE